MDALDGHRVVKLNVGGHLFMTTVSTLVGRGDNFFSTLFKGNTPSLRDESGAFFIDRDGTYFAPLLSFLRTGELEIPPTMPKRLVEREALFYLIDLSSAGIFTNPLTKTSVSLGGVAHTDLRHDGVYLQRQPYTGAFVGYYIFNSNDEVRYRSINNLTANELVYSRPSRFTKLSHPWLVMHWGNAAHPCKIVASIQPHGLTVEWRYPPRPEHCKPLALPFYPSVEPLLGVLFSDEVQQKSTTPINIRLHFADRSRVQMSVQEKGKKGSVRRSAEYAIETRDGLTFVRLSCSLLEMTLLSLGGLLVEVNLLPNRADESVPNFNYASRSLRVFVAVGTEPEAEEGEADEIDIYEFLRTYHPQRDRDQQQQQQHQQQLEDSSEMDDDVQSLDEPYIMGRNMGAVQLRYPPGPNDGHIDL